MLWNLTRNNNKIKKNRIIVLINGIFNKFVILKHFWSSFSIKLVISKISIRAVSIKKYEYWIEKSSTSQTQANIPTELKIILKKR